VINRLSCGRPENRNSIIPFKFNKCFIFISVHGECDIGYLFSFQSVKYLFNKLCANFVILMLTRNTRVFNVAASPVMSTENRSDNFEVNFRDKRCIWVSAQESFHSIAAIVNIVQPHPFRLPLGINFIIISDFKCTYFHFSLFASLDIKKPHSACLGLSVCLDRKHTRYFFYAYSLYVSIQPILQIFLIPSWCNIVII